MKPEQSTDKHTPGPWTLGPSDQGVNFTAVNSLHWEELCVVVTRMAEHDKDSISGLANAKLIAAAPEMLSALKAAEIAFREMCEWHGATHTNKCPADDTCNCTHKPFNDRINAAGRLIEAAIYAAEPKKESAA